MKHSRSKSEIKLLRELDIGLLLAFEAVLQERSVTRAAVRLGLSQSALSGAISRLRTIFGDTLFIRTSEGMNPSPVATELYGAIKEALDILRGTVGSSIEFEPTSQKTFAIGMSDYASNVILPTLVRHIRARYPNITLHIETIPPSRINRLLEEGEIDLAVSVQPPINSNFSFRHLLDETFAVVMCQSNPLARGALTLEQYVQAPHLLVAPDGLRTGWRGIIDDKLAEVGKSRTVYTTSQSFLLSFLSLGNTDLVMTAPKRLVALYARKLGLAVRPSPIDAGSFPVALIWHSRSSRQPALSWLRQEIVRITAGL